MKLILLFSCFKEISSSEGISYGAGASSTKAEEYVLRWILTVIWLKIFGVLASNKRSESAKISPSTASGARDGGRYPEPARDEAIGRDDDTGN